VTTSQTLLRRAEEYETLACWHGERAPCEPSYAAAADALRVAAIVLREVATALEGDDGD
jgi:hypothetical protein